MLRRHPKPGDKTDIKADPRIEKDILIARCAAGDVAAVGLIGQIGHPQ